MDSIKGFYLHYLLLWAIMKKKECCIMEENREGIVIVSDEEVDTVSDRLINQNLDAYKELAK